MQPFNEPSPVELVLKLKRQHCGTWRDKPDWYWALGLLEEILELLLSLAGLHQHLVGWELQQVASICLNWLEYRRSRGLW